MKYYKVMFNDRVIDVLDQLIYLKYQEKHDIMVLCNESEAQAVLSSEKDMIWHVKGWYDIPVDRYETVELIEIDQFEYKELCGKSTEDKQSIIDNFVMELVEAGIL